MGGEERHVTVRSTRHGPVISDVMQSAARSAPQGNVLALAWAALSERQRRAARRLRAQSRARSPTSSSRHCGISTRRSRTWCIADREGHIGFVAPALVPVRRADNEAMGRVPVPGWDAKYDWQGFIPYEKLPALFGSAERSASSPRTTRSRRRATSRSSRWTGIPPYRADRIETLLARAPEAFARLLRGDAGRHALVPGRARCCRSPAPPSRLPRQGRAAQAMLTGWNGTMTVDSAAAARLRRVVSRAHAPRLRRRAGRALRRFLGPAPALHDRGDEGRARPGLAGATT